MDKGEQRWARYPSNVVRSKSPKRSTRTKVLGKMLGEVSMKSDENPHKSPKRTLNSSNIYIEPRPLEVKAERELSLSPVKKTHVGGAVSPVRSPKKTPKLKLSNTQSKLLGGTSTSIPRLHSDSSNTLSKLPNEREKSNEYKVTFPAGAMGLELEPVVISSACKIGCRVRDFYLRLGL